MEQTAVLNLRIAKALRRKLDKAVKAQRRTIRAVVEAALRRELEAKEQP